LDHQPVVDPLRSAVIVVDVQRAFTDLLDTPLSPAVSDVLPNITRFLARARDAAVTVFLVRLVIAPDDDSRNTAIWGEAFRNLVRPGAPGTEWNPCLNPHKSDVEIVKRRYSAFFGTELDALLRERNVETVVICGLTTNVCVQSTVRDAWQRDYQTITLSDCCSEDGEGAHSSALSWIARNFGSVHTSGTVLKMWRA
jgi:biuret amidohydrolase